MDDDFSVLVVQTGGTIDKDYPRSTGQYGFEIGDSAALRVLKESFAAVTFAVHGATVCRKDSQDITSADRQHLADRLAHATEEHILVTHGTDTMIETAQFLAEDARLGGKRVVFVGSFKPECFKGSDAAFNVGVAIGGLQYCRPGVYIAMNGRVRNCSRVERHPSTGTFRARHGVSRHKLREGTVHQHRPHPATSTGAAGGRNPDAHKHHHAARREELAPAARGGDREHGRADPVPDHVSHERHRGHGHHDAGGEGGGGGTEGMQVGSPQLHDVFLNFCRFGKGQSITEEMDGKRWVKFCKENHFFEIDPGRYNSTGADLVFSKLAGRGRKTITFETFCDKGLPEVAKRLGLDLARLLSHVQGPKLSGGTRAEFTRFHDDQSSWTGVATRGGPTTVDVRNRPTLASQANRDNKADVRGVVHKDHRHHGY